MKFNPHKEYIGKHYHRRMGGKTDFSTAYGILYLRGKKVVRRVKQTNLFSQRSFLQYFPHLLRGVSLQQSINMTLLQSTKGKQAAADKIRTGVIIEF